MASEVAVVAFVTSIANLIGVVAHCLYSKRRHAATQGQLDRVTDCTQAHEMRITILERYK